MHTVTKRHKNIKDIIIWVMIGTTAIIAASCIDHYNNPTIHTNSTTVVFKINTKKSNITHTRTQTEHEVAVSTVTLLVFEDRQRNGTFEFKYKVNGSEVIDQNQQSTKFQATLQCSETPMKLFFVANADDVFEHYTPQAGDSENTVKKGIRKSFTPSDFSEVLPMYGEALLPHLVDGTNTTLNITMLRAVARVDVIKELSSSSPGFVMKEVYVFRANDKIQLIPNSLADGKMNVFSPSVPAGTTALNDQVVKINHEGSDFIGGIYIPESAGVSNIEERQFSATTVVVGGIAEEDEHVSYYRADFHSTANGHPFGQVLRNHLYRFVIKKVTSSGWNTPKEAAENFSSSIQMDVQEWEDFDTSIYWSNDYIKMSTFELHLPFLPYYERSIAVESTVEYQIQWLDGSGKPVGAAVSKNTPLSNEYFTATITPETEGDIKISHIRVSSTDYNKSDLEYSSLLRLKANGKAVDIKIIKESPKRYKNRVFQVLSSGTPTNYGCLGNATAVGANTKAMRKVLDVNFAPNSSFPFKIGGFSFWTIDASSPNGTNAITKAEIAHFRKTLMHIDILVLPQFNTTSTAITNFLLDEWLVNNPHKVLWVHRDTNNSNINVLERTKKDGEGEWTNLSGHLPHFGFRASGAKDYKFNNAKEIYEFFNGPFGTISENCQFNSADATAGNCLINDSCKKHVTPLIYNNNNNFKNYMLMGVNKKRGIIYSGESQFFYGAENYPMSPDASQSGNIDISPKSRYMDVLNANTWAWVVGRVIYGPPNYSFENP